MGKYILVFLLASAVFLAQAEPAAKAATDSGEQKPEAAAAKPVQPAPKPVPKSPHPRVRTGSVTKIEFTSSRPEADSKSPVSKKSSSGWVVLTIALDPGRAASIFDYVLRKDGTEYPCLDVADGEDIFEGKLRIYSAVDGKRCRLVFAVPSASGEYELVFKLIPNDGNPVKLKAK